MFPGAGGLTPEHDVDAAQYQLQLITADFANQLSQLTPVYCDDGRDVRNRVLGQTCHSGRQKDITGSFGPVEIASQGHTDDSADPATI